MRDDIDMEADAGPDGLPFRAAFESCGDHLDVQVEGRIEGVDHLIALFLQVADAMRRFGTHKVLVVDHTHGVVPDESEMRQLMSAMGGQGYENVRLAYVDARGTAISRMEVGEILGRERGYECRVFDSQQRARIWLNYGSE